MVIDQLRMMINRPGAFFGRNYYTFKEVIAYLSGYTVAQNIYTGIDERILESQVINQLSEKYEFDHDIHLIEDLFESIFPDKNDQEKAAILLDILERINQSAFLSDLEDKNNMDLNQLTEKIKNPLKEMGYKKHNYTWVKKNDDEICIIVNFQRSQYGGSFYMNLGIYINSLGIKQFPNICLADCQMQERINITREKPELFIQIVKKWEEWYGSYELIREKALSRKMPMMTDKRVYTYLLIK